MNQEFSDSEIKALISLLDETDEKLSKQIIDKIISSGTSAIPFLFDAWENNLSDIVQERIYFLIDKIQYNEIKINLNNWNSNTSKSILDAWVIITKYQFPALNVQSITDYINRLKYDVWVELNENQTALEKIKILNHVFFQIHNLKIENDYILIPESYLINHIIAYSKGSPTAISILYQIIAHKLDIPIWGLNYFEYSILCYLKPDSISKPITLLKKEDVLFYIVISNRVTVVAADDIEIVMDSINIKTENRFFTPCSQNQVVQKIIIGVQNAFKNLKIEDKATIFEKLLKIL